MGKSRKPRKNFRSNPINGNSTNGDVDISEEFVPQADMEVGFSKSEKLISNFMIIKTSSFWKITKIEP